MSHPGNKAFECILHMIQYAYQERHTGFIYKSDKPVTPVAWYDASDARDPTDSITMG
eukprot:SAG31_NODE_32085_length_360_cov_0.796935_1_plen_56_part_01